jgi:hypothetical protein
MANGQEPQERQKKEKTIQWKRRNERLERIRKAKGVRRVRVVPRDDEIRENIKHQPGGIAFPAEGSVEWPLDNFTKRRLRDGDVKLESQEDSKARDEQRRRDRQRPRHSEPQPNN